MTIKVLRCYRAGPMKRSLIALTRLPIVFMRNAMARMRHAVG
jgi:hypothetical protein